VVGFSHYKGERFGPIGVDPEERGKGIGQRLMFATLNAQRDAGHRTSWFLWSDERTANRLYNGAGFKLARTFALLRKQL
jgi:mycothiol synthase